MSNEVTQRWIAVAPSAAREALQRIVDEGLPAPAPSATRVKFLRVVWPWRFHGGTTQQFVTPRGSSLYFADVTSFGHLVVSVEDDRDGLVEHVQAIAGIEPVAEVARRSERAADVPARLHALFALAAAQGMARGTALPELEAAVKRALDDPSPIVRLAGIRSVAILPAASAFALLDGRDDPENPDLPDWRSHFQKLATQS